MNVIKNKMINFIYEYITKYYEKEVLFYEKKQSGIEEIPA